mmetsp:Transcript_12067/g.34004  ORF Transcript_12067/g.34004 Transcript_12067/m.34004 type:complete len:191 (+) Transcript_12067:1-573(+)
MLRTGGLRNRLRRMMESVARLFSSSRPSFYSHVWDPPLIVAQMATMQMAFWFLYGGCIVLAGVLGHPPVDLAAVFGHEALCITSSPFFWESGLALHASALGAGGMLAFVVGRSRKCLDFATTVMLFHILAVALYSFALPACRSAWLCYASALALLYAVGTFLCRHVELTEIPILPLTTRKSVEVSRMVRV